MTLLQLIARRAVTLGAIALVLAIVAATGASSLNGPPALKADDAPDLILYNGKIATVDASNSFVEAVAIRDGKIVATGQKGQVKALARPGTQVVNLNKRTVLPGLIDGTLHGVRNGYHCFSRAVRHELNYTRSAALAAYAARGAQLPDDVWVFTTGGWNVNQLDVPGMFTKAELDAALPANPVLVSGDGFTGSQTNSRGLALLGLPTTGTGQLAAAQAAPARRAIGTQLEQLSIDDQASCLREFLRAANRAGLTAWDDPGGNDPFDPQGRAIEAFREGHGFQAVNQLNREGRLDARIVLHLTSFAGLANVLRDTRHAFSMIGDDMLRIGGPGEEIMATVGGVYPQPEYQEIVNHLARNRWNFEHHASLGITQRTMLDAWEAANALYPIADLNWVMLHPHDGPENPTAETLARVKALGAGIVPTDSNVQGGGEEHPPYRRIYESGARSCLGTDAMNAGPYAPFINIWYTISGKTLEPGAAGVLPEQRLSRAQALRMATANCASIVDLEGKVGTLELGRYGDLIVLSKDYFSVPEDEIRKLTSVLTVVDGRIVYADAEFAALDD
jgi:predicted amidohydrolase YtcJ